MTKAELYHAIDDFRARYGLAVSRDPLCVQDFCKARLNLKIDIHPYHTPGLRGVAIMGRGIISLDANMMPERRKYYCAHEMLHFFLDYNEDNVIRCFDHDKSITEWQANEGAAEIVMPRRAFLREVNGYAPGIKTGWDFARMKKYLAGYFNVTPTMIYTRIDSLKYEIAQSLQGVPIERMAVLSDRQQARQGIKAISLNQIYIDVFVEQDMMCIPKDFNLSGYSV